MRQRWQGVGQKEKPMKREVHTHVQRGSVFGKLQVTQNVPARDMGGEVAEARSWGAVLRGLYFISERG